MKKLIHKNKNFLFILILGSLSIVLNFYYGYRGIFPTDSFLIFDSGYYVLNGFYPFKDYWTVTGPLLDYIQACLFYIFGINWFSYVLHAALINLILAVFSFVVFVQLNFNKIKSFIYSFGISLLAYPIVGTPFMDHHSTIFSILAVYFFILGIEKEKSFFWFCIPIFLICSFLSKQIPAAYISIFIFLILFFFLYINFDIKKIYFLLLGTIFSLFFFSLFFIIYEISINDFIIQYFLYPLSIGSERVENLSFSFKKYISHFKYIYICLIPLFAILAKIIIKNKKNISEKKDFIVILAVFGMALIFIYTQIITKNQILIFFMIPLLTAFSHIYYFKYFKNKIFIYFIILVCLFSVTKYHFRYNEHKKFMELENVNFQLAVDAGKISKIFKGLNWITTYFPKDPEQEIKNLTEISSYINLSSKNKIIITDYQFFSAISKDKSNTFIKVNKWYDAVSTPTKKNKYFPNYENFFVNKINKNNIEEIYGIGIDNKFKYFKDFVNDESCVGKKIINEMLIVYDITHCKF